LGAGSQKWWKQQKNNIKGREPAPKRAERAAPFPFFGNKEPKAGAGSQNCQLPQKGAEKAATLFWEQLCLFLGANMELTPCRGSQSRSWLTFFGSSRRPALG